jgi:hypothetical protein
MGMGDFERGASMQQVVNSAWNLYLDAIKMSIYPPVAINKDVIASPSSISYIPAAKWMLRTGQGPVAGHIAPIQLNPRGIENFNNTYQIANGSLLNLFGTTDTTVTQQTETGFGKTPQALQMQQARENTRDNADRFFMEKYLQKVYKKFVNLISKKQSSAITLRMFDSEIDELARTYEDIRQMYDPNTGKLTIDKKTTGNVIYDYEIVSGSTFATDEKTQQQNLMQLLQLFIANPQQGQSLMQLLDQQGYTVKLGEMFKRMVAKTGIQDWDKIIEEKTPQEIYDSQIQQYSNQLNMAAQQMLGGSMSQTPTQQAGQMPMQGQPTGQMTGQGPNPLSGGMPNV